MSTKEIFKSRILDLTKRAYNRDIVTFTDFLDLQELNIINNLGTTSLGVSCQFYGGYQMSERQMVAFIPDAFSHSKNTLSNLLQYPIDCIKIVPLAVKFAEALNHRDYLGALVNLGIERSVIGDILVKGSYAYVFCLRRMTPFITENCTRIKHTNVKCEVIDHLTEVITPEFETITGSVASIRLDSIIGLAFKSSRSNSNGLIEGKKVFVHSKLITSNAYQLKPNDVVSVRGFGKFIYVDELSKTKKGRCRIQINRYI